ncbi:Zinc phosphodiesterase ELAC protein 2 [Phytophthora megakarya]|uniref:Zinc phosphodiesterase ELAC protein 2 n=1 Tax=Phytophthora megakarya TaxID=4795 RepID=A0A225V8C8_9STRA|nr:Zinc phosphodiesterase ELAC protein 2 [Phytophthora megakarya]
MPLLLSTETGRYVSQGTRPPLYNAVPLTFVCILRSFMFNVGDDTQRLCMQHHVRLTKLQQD